MVLRDVMCVWLVLVLVWCFASVVACACDEEWSQLSPALKAPYHEKHRMEKQRYEQELVKHKHERKHKHKHKQKHH